MPCTISTIEHLLAKEEKIPKKHRCKIFANYTE
ncbi:hypothetical protein CA85_52590 [Allorhodopirellula solitaria]|uniref:Uncharacterized protein n=1 Tax=Allorhodopirellula solitaria TaxID=2527987 RepID=A0A5C5WMS9_9BACT|nr:hypothetical protein CA85_52590 [Allorhodopirellula solitaria]